MLDVLGEMSGFLTADVTLIGTLMKSPEILILFISVLLASC
jgi:hypothetical protein